MLTLSPNYAQIMLVKLTRKTFLRSQ